MNQPVCLITGVGDGTGIALVRRFARSNYQVAMLARNRDRLQKLESELPNTKAYVCDVGDLLAHIIIPRKTFARVLLSNSTARLPKAN